MIRCNNRDLSWRKSLYRLGDREADHDRDAFRTLLAMGLSLCAANDGHDFLCYGGRCGDFGSLVGIYITLLALLIREYLTVWTKRLFLRTSIDPKSECSLNDQDAYVGIIFVQKYSFSAGIYIGIYFCTEIFLFSWSLLTSELYTGWQFLNYRICMFQINHEGVKTS